MSAPHPNPLLNSDTSSTPEVAVSKPIEASLPLRAVRKRPWSQNQDLSLPESKPMRLNLKDDGPKITATMQFRSYSTNFVESTTPMAAVVESHKYDRKSQRENDKMADELRIDAASKQIVAEIFAKHGTELEAQKQRLPSPSYEALMGPNEAPMLVPDAAAMGRLESSRSLIHGSSGYLKSRVGGVTKWLHGYQYDRNHGNGSGDWATHYWRCAQKMSLGCPAILHTKGAAAGGGKPCEILTRKHNHNPDPDALEAKLALEDMKIEAFHTDKSAKQIVAEICAKLTEAQKQRLPSDVALMEQIRRVRRKKAQQETQS